MEYRFGPDKPKFTGTDDEWNELKKEIAWWNEETSNYPFVTVICPHCGAKNTHRDDRTSSHRVCDLMTDKKGRQLMYDCPGYYICKISKTKGEINTRSVK
jgi:transposase